MKKFVKVSLITAGVLMAVGIVLSVIATVAGGSSLMRYVGHVFWDIDWDDDMDLEDLAQLVQIEDREQAESMVGIFEKERENRYGASESANESTSASHKKFSLETGNSSVTKMEIALGAGELTVYEKEEDDGRIDVEWSGNGSFQADIRKGTLYIQGFQNSRMLSLVSDPSDNSAVVYLPRGMTFREADIAVGAGKAQIYDLSAGETEISLGAGKVILERASTGELSVEAGAGEFSGLDVMAGDVDFSVGIGTCTYTGSITGNLEAECGMGSMDLMLEGKETDYNYRIECAAGKVVIGGQSYTGLASEKSIYNGAARSVEIECSMGEVSVGFQE